MREGKVLKLGSVRKFNSNPLFAERDYDDVRTQTVTDLFLRERALEVLLACAGLHVGYGSDDSTYLAAVGNTRKSWGQ